MSVRETLKAVTPYLKEVAKFVCKAYVPGGGIIVEALEGYERIEHEGTRRKIEAIVEVLQSEGEAVLQLAAQLNVQSQEQMEMLANFPAIKAVLDRLPGILEARVDGLYEFLGQPASSVQERPQPQRSTPNVQTKLRVLKEADQCHQPGQIGALLRREGLYSSNLSDWRKKREAGVLTALTPKKRGKQKKSDDALSAELQRLQRQNQQLLDQLAQAEKIIAVPKKISEIFTASTTKNTGSF